jgi:hypothetical protein
VYAVNATDLVDVEAFPEPIAKEILVTRREPRCGVRKRRLERLLVNVLRQELIGVPASVCEVGEGFLRSRQVSWTLARGIDDEPADHRAKPGPEAGAASVLEDLRLRTDEELRANALPHLFGSDRAGAPAGAVDLVGEVELLEEEHRRGVAARARASEIEVGGMLDRERRLEAAGRTTLREEGTERRVRYLNLRPTPPDVDDAGRDGRVRIGIVEEK